MTERRVNDIGGIDPHGWGDIPKDTKAVPDWAKLATALGGALGTRGAGLVCLHEVRRAREDLGPERYFGLGYFELSLQGLYDMVIEKGILTEDEVAERMARLRGG